jgi:hypothetical protein
VGQPLPLVPLVVKLSYTFSYGSDATVMTHLYWQGGAGSPTTTDLTAFANLAKTSYETYGVASQTNQVTLRKIHAVYLGDTTGASVDVTTADTGSRSGGPLAANVAVLVNLKIARRYRGGHPRIYLPWGSATDILDPQHWTSGALSQFQTSINSIVTQLQGFSGSSFATPTLCSVSYYHNKALRTTPVVDSVSATPVSSTPGSQRRRLRP